MFPESGRSLPFMRFKRVVLPEPLLPMRAIFSSLGHWKLKLEKRSFVPNDFPIFCSRIKDSLQRVVRKYGCIDGLSISYIKLILLQKLS